MEGMGQPQGRRLRRLQRRPDGRKAQPARLGERRWGFTSEAVQRRPALLDLWDGRAWDKWPEPTAVVGEAECAFQLCFPTLELAMTAKRQSSWHRSSVLLIETPEDPDIATAVSLLTSPDREPVEVEPPAGVAEFGVFAVLPLTDGRSVQLASHQEPAAPMIKEAEVALDRIRDEHPDGFARLPKTAYFYGAGRKENGTRWVVAARVWR